MPLNVLHCCFDGGEDGIQPEINEIDSGHRNHQTSMQDDARVQDMIKNIEQRSFVSTGLRWRENCIGLVLNSHPIYRLHSN